MQYKEEPLPSAQFDVPKGFDQKTERDWTQTEAMQ